MVEAFLADMRGLQLRKPKGLIGGFSPSAVSVPQMGALQSYPEKGLGL